MNWRKQTEDLVKSLMDVQRRTWDSATEGIRNVATAPIDEMWEQSLNASEGFLLNSVKAQAELSDTMVENITAIDGLPEPAVETVEQFQAMMHDLSKNQEKLLATWFDMMKALDPSKAMASYTDAVRHPLVRMQDVTRKAIDAQMNMMRMWMGVGRNGATRTRRKSTPKRARAKVAKKPVRKRKRVAKKKKVRVRKKTR